MSKRILVADDDRAILEAITMILELGGYEVKTTSNGADMKQVLRYAPDLILLDIWMSGFDGKDICRALKSNNKTKHIPIIMISANKDTEKIAKDVGADGYMSKPFDMHHLLSVVAKYTASV